MEVAEKKKPKVPKLRFREFEGGWFIVKLKNAAKIQRGRFSPRPRNNPIYYGGEYPFVQTSDVVNCNGKIEFFSQSLNEKGLAVSKLFPKGTILMTIAANIGHTGVLQQAMACPDSLIGIVCNENVHNYFLNFYLSTQQARLDYLAPEAAQKNLNIEFLNPYPVVLTSLPEQKKIADFLSAADARIQQLNRKKELLETYKKGVMQKLFSQELRFKQADGTSYADWEEKRLGEVFERVTRKNKENNQNVLTISAQQGLINQEEYFNKSVSANNVTGYYLLNKGEFAYNKSYSKGYPMGAVKRLNRYDKGVVSTLYICFRMKTDDVPEYWEQVLDNGGIDNELKKIAQEGARNHGLLNLSVVEFFRDIDITRPCKEEQQKIADFLSSLDKKIGGVSAQIEKTQQFKKGLLQQMFV